MTVIIDYKTVKIAQNKNAFKSLDIKLLKALRLIYLLTNSINNLL